MITTWLFAFGLAPGTAPAATPKLKPTRTEWCAALLSVRDRRPAPADDAVAAVAAARQQLDEILRRHHPATAALVDDAPAPHRRRVEANVSRQGPLDVDMAWGLRRARGRLAGLARDLARPDAGVSTLARVDVGRPAVTAALDEIAAEATAHVDRARSTPGSEYYVRTIGNGAALTSLVGGFGLATEHFVSYPNQNLFGLFLGATMMSAWGLWDFVHHHRRHLATEGGRVALENRHNPERTGGELEVLDRLRRLTRAGDADLFAHHGYAVGRRRASTVLVDLVLFENTAGEPVLVTALRRRDLPTE